MAVTVLRVETKPVLDPYHRDTWGASTTVVKVRPDMRLCYACQEYDDHATPQEEYTRRRLVVYAPVRPDEDALREFLLSLRGQELLDAICDGHTVEWDGDNMVGVLSPAAEEALLWLEEALGDLPESPWTLMSCADYVQDAEGNLGITPYMDDEGLRDLNYELQAYAQEDHIVLADDLLTHLEDLRAHLRDEEGTE